MRTWNCGGGEGKSGELPGDALVQGVRECAPACEAYGCKLVLLVYDWYDEVCSLCVNS